MEYQEFLQKERARISEHRNEIKKCPYCDHSIEDNMESITQSLIEDLRNVYNWLGEKNRHVFKISEISHLLSKSSYANFSNLREAGGLMYSPTEQEKLQVSKDAGGVGWYGVNMKRVGAFFRGEFTIPRQYIKHGITGEKMAADYVHISDFPKMVELLGRDGIYNPDRHYTERIYRVESKNGRPTIEEYLKSQPATLFDRAL